MHNPIRLVFSLLCGLLLTAGANAASDDSLLIAEGTDYQAVSPAQPGADGDRVRVTELFWYGCPHCYDLEPKLHAWLEEKPDYIEFERMPAVFGNPRWKLHARAFFTAELLGVMDAFHKPFFDAIHKGGKRMASPGEIKAFFAGLGVDGQTFDDTFNSFGVQAKLGRAVDMTGRYGIDGVPAMIIDGKYRTDGPMAGNHERMLQVVEQLADELHTRAMARAE